MCRLAISAIAGPSAGRAASAEKRWSVVGKNASRTIGFSRM